MFKPFDFEELDPKVREEIERKRVQQASAPDSVTVPVPSAPVLENKKEPVLSVPPPSIQEAILPQENKREKLRKQLYENLINKYGLDKREELLQKINNENKGFDWAIFGAGLGSALQGRGGQGASDLYNMKMARQEQMRKDFDTNKSMLQKDLQALDEEAERGELKDPNSNFSRALQNTLKTMMPNRDFSKYNGEQLMKVFPFLKTEYEIAEKREERARQEREKQLEILRMARGNPIRMEVLQKAANEKERDKALEEADLVQTSQRTIENLLDLYKKTERGEISRDAFSSIAKTVLGNYRKVVPETEMSLKTIGGISKAIEDVVKTQGRYTLEDFEKALYGIKTLTEDNVKTLNSLGIKYEIQLPFGNKKYESSSSPSSSEKRKSFLDKPSPKVGTMIRLKDGKVYRIINEKGDLEPVGE